MIRDVAIFSFVLLEVVTFNTSFIHADCDPIRAEVIPESGSVIVTNGQFLLSFGSVHTTLDGAELALASESGEVQLEVVGRYSSYWMTQFLVRPQEDLQPNSTYRLLVRAPLRGHDAMESWFWTTGTGPDLSQPEWEEPPEVLSTGNAFECCGWTVANVGAQIVDESEPILILTEVIDGSYHDGGQYIVPFQDGQILVGRSGCTGGFIFETNTEVRAALTAIDLAGNTAETPGSGLVFVVSDSAFDCDDCD